DGSDVEELLKHADLAMHRAKADGGNAMQLYAADMHSRAQEARDLDSELRRAVEDNQFVLYYQPQVDLRAGASWGRRRWCAGAGLEEASPARASSWRVRKRMV